MQTKEEKAEYGKKYRQTHKVEMAEHYQTHKVEKAEYGKKYRQTHKVEMAEHYQTHKVEMAEKQKEYNLQTKTKVMSHYGKDGKPACVQCGYNKDIHGLELDHTNGNGSEHRRNIGTRMYLWVVQNNFPEGFQTLCGTCHTIKTINSHIEKNKKELVNAQ
jgi:hypothetical protein